MSSGPEQRIGCGGWALVFAFGFVLSPIALNLLELYALWIGLLLVLLAAVARVLRPAIDRLQLARPRSATVRRFVSVAGVVAFGVGLTFGGVFAVTFYGKFIVVNETPVPLTSVRVSPEHGLSSVFRRLEPGESETIVFVPGTGGRLEVDYTYEGTVYRAKVRGYAGLLESMHYRVTGPGTEDTNEF